MVYVPIFQGEQGPTLRVSLLPLVFQLEALSIPLSACVSSVKSSERIVCVFVSQGELWALEPGDPRKNQMSVLLGEG